MGKVYDFQTRREISPTLIEFMRAAEIHNQHNLKDIPAMLVGFEEAMKDIATQIESGKRVVGYAFAVDFHAPKEGVERHIRYAGPMGPGHVTDMAESIIHDYRTS